jgi:tetratricopeptide (TPR) repeat protein
MRPVPLSQSPLWPMQRAHYEREATEAFATVPHQIVDNPFVAAAFARVVGGFYRDCARSALEESEPLYIVELGAGAGRFAHGFVRELAAWANAVPLALPPIVYVMTDLGEGTLDDWAANGALADASLDFARFDLTIDRTLALRRRGIELERLANPLVVIANYVFDSVPADAFAVSGADVAAMEVAYSRVPVAENHYSDPDLDALLEHYRGTLSDTVVTIPRAAFDCVRRLRMLAGDRLLVLAADKAHSTAEALDLRSEPDISRHGSVFSLMVNFHALAWYARRHGGEALTGGDRHAAIDVGAFLFGDQPFPETRLAYEEAIERFGPEDFSLLAEGLEHAAEELSVAELVAVLRLSRWDAFTLLGVAHSLRGSVGDADPAVQEDLRAALYEIYDRHYAVPGEGDLPFTIATLLYEMEDYEDALEFFNASLEQHGPHEATRKNIELCEQRL